jgi:hypothetical protein
MGQEAREKKIPSFRDRSFLEGNCPSPSTMLVSPSKQIAPGSSAGPRDQNFPSSSVDLHGFGSLKDKEGIKRQNNLHQPFIYTSHVFTV